MVTIDISALKAQHDLGAIIGRDVALRRSSRELLGLCPFHEEKTPSFRVNEAKGLFHCFGCGASGDVIDYVRWRHGLSFTEALRWLETGAGSTAVAPRKEHQREADEQARQEARTAAQALWQIAEPVLGTPAERYLHSRGIVAPAPASIRFARLPVWRTASGAVGPQRPTLVAACQDAKGTVVGVQRIFLTRDGRKASMKNPKLSLGQIRGTALRLGPVATEIILCEGPEDGLTLRQRLPNASVWVSLGTGNLPFVELPAEVRSVVIAGDNNAAGRGAAAFAAECYGQQGRGVRLMFPDAAYLDWNDELLGKRSQAGEPVS